MNTYDERVPPRDWSSAALIAFVVLSVALAFPSMRAQPANGATAAQTPSPHQDIPDAQTIQPNELAKELANNGKPTVVCVAPHFLYQGAHSPGALFHGPGSSPEGLKDLRQWAQAKARDADIVIYCGCCPMARCPNVGPALHALTEMGFTHVKVLWLAKDFHTDWIDKGYPTEKGQ